MMEQLIPMRAFPKIDAALPMFKKLLTLKLLPNATASSTESMVPTRHLFLMLIAEP
jgi:hypothetical protein